jgi:hypothetical protein
MPDLFEPLNMTEGQKAQSDFQRIALNRSEEAPPNSRSPSSYTLPNESTTAVAPSTPPPPPTEVCEQEEEKAPKLFVDREGDQIVRIRVLCGCGKSTTLKCTYPDFSSEDQELGNSSPTPGEDLQHAHSSIENTPKTSE